MKCVGYYLILLGVVLTGCGDGGKSAGGKAVLPVPGTVVAQAAMPVTGDSLNNFAFAVTVSADSLIESGVYAVRASYGFDTANGRFVMPKGLKTYVIVMKKGVAAYTYVVGFTTSADTTFNDYFEITGTRTSIDMHYLKAYTFE